jgi:hypothetical protein
MQTKTQAALDALRVNDWFCNVGHPDSEEVEFVFSWREAIARCESLEWVNIQEDSLNILRVRVRKYSVELYDTWNDLVDVLKPVILPLVELKARDVVAREGLPKVFLDSVNWDILAICLALEYSDLVPIDPKLHWLNWYAGGHFPCGWQGAFPDGGKLIVF